MRRISRYSEKKSQLARYSCDKHRLDNTISSSMFLKIRKSTENYSFRLFYQINFRPTKTDKNSEELVAADRHVEKYKEVLEKICRKFVQNPTSNNTNAVNVDQDARDKRCKKVHEYKLAQSMEESLKDLPEGLLRDVLENCGKFSLFLSMDINQK